MGYRQHSFDPNAYEGQGKPLRPFNWVQWLGVAFGVAGIAISLAYLAGRLGWMPELLDNPSLGTPLVLAAVVLISSRRQTIPDLAPELAPARKRWMIIIVTLCIVFIGGATILQLLGV